MSADLHCHSHHSDGALAPADLARRAADNGVTLWALTDHDTLDGLPEAAAAAADHGLDFVAGVEVSVTFAGETVHVLGLGVDAAHAPLRDGLAALRAGRLERARAMSDGLARVGIRGALEGALALAPNPESISRTHFARWLVARGHCADNAAVFRRYLGWGKPGYVEHRWATLGQAMGWIRGAGGVAVLAHPARYRLSPNEEAALLTDFAGHGGAGIEVWCAAHGATDEQHALALAREFELAPSAGSDFHAPGESRLDLGAVPNPDCNPAPIWNKLQASTRELPST